MNLQERILKSLKETKKPTVEEINEARWAEQEKEQLDAETVGVSPDDYRKWASGRPMPHVDEAVKRLAAKTKP